MVIIAQAENKVKKEVRNVGYKKTIAQDIELLKNFSENIRLYGGIRSTFSELEKVDDKYAEEIDKLYSKAILMLPIYIEKCHIKNKNIYLLSLISSIVAYVIANISLIICFARLFQGG